MSALLAVLLSAAPAIDAVVLYPDRAQVTRATEVTCGAKVAVAFSGITPAAAADSFRARCEGGTVEGLRVESKVRTDEFAPQVKALAVQLKALEAEGRALGMKRARAEQQAGLAERFAEVAVAQVSRELAAERPDPKVWAQAFDGPLKTQLAAREVMAAADVALRELEVKRQTLQGKLSQLDASAQRSEFLAQVVVRCPAGRSARVELTYLVGAAGWQPSYEARADEAGAAVELTTYATLTQRTGEAWEKARLTLSTAVPSQNATPPELKQLKVAAQEQKPEKKVLVARSEAVEQAESGSGAVANGAGLTARAQGLSVQLAIPERATVLGDGTSTRVRVNGTRLKARFASVAAPKLLPFVFRVAELTNQAPFPLLPGPVSVFRASGFLARASLERVPEGGFFRLTFGVDDSLRVKRVVLEELKRDAGLFGGKRRFTYGYRFELANYGKAPVELELSEHLPVAEVDDVQVGVEAKTTAGYQLNAQTGVATWRVKLKPAEQRNVELAYRVEVPSSYDTGGL